MNSVGRVLLVGVTSLRIQIKDRSNIFFMVMMPLGFIFFFGIVIGGGGDPTDVQVSLAVVDRDGGFLARSFIERLQTDDNVAFEEWTQARLDTAASKPLRVLIIPEAFTEKILNEERVAMTFRKKPDSNLDYDFAADIHLYMNVVRMVGAMVEWSVTHEGRLAESEDAEEEILAILTQPDHVTAQAEVAGRGRPVPAGYQQSVPGVLTMFVLMSVLIGGAVELTEEKRSGVLRRLATTPLSRREILGGKIAGHTFVGLVQTSILVGAGVIMAAIPGLNVDFDWGTSYGALALLLLVFNLSVAGLSLMMGAIFRTAEQAGGLGWLTGMVFSGLGGCWWPLEIVPPFMKKLALFFPTGWAMTGFHNLTSFGLGLGSIVPAMAALLFFFAVYTSIGARLMRFEG